MGKVLLLFSKASVDEGKAHPEKLVQLIIEQQSVDAEFELFENLSYLIDKEATKISLPSGKDIAEYDTVYLRRWFEIPDKALSVAIYLKSRNRNFVDAEAYFESGSFSKLSQYFRLWEHNLSIPKTFYGPANSEVIDEIEFPVIVKSATGTRGEDNHLVNNHDELHKILDQHPDDTMLIQHYIENDFDYRLFVAGGEVKLVIKRLSQDGHLNNLSKGGASEIVDVNSIPQQVLEDSVKAAAVFKRDIAGVDVVMDPDNNHYFFEVNRAPQIEDTDQEVEKAKILSDYLS